MEKLRSLSAWVKKNVVTVFVGVVMLSVATAIWTAPATITSKGDLQVVVDAFNKKASEVASDARIAVDKVELDNKIRYQLLQDNKVDKAMFDLAVANLNNTVAIRFNNLEELMRNQNKLSQQLLNMHLSNIKEKK